MQAGPSEPPACAVQRDMSNDKPTIIPAAYPELEHEAYASLYEPEERPTMVPAAEEQLGLEVDCLLGEEK